MSSDPGPKRAAKPMSAATNPDPIETNGSSSLELGSAIEPPATAVKATLEHLLASASANSAFGQPVQHENGVVVPAAEVLAVVGFGFGAGKVPGVGSDQLGNGTGGGGGGYVMTRPVATIVVTPHQVHQELIIDVTKIALAALTAAGMIAGMAFRMRGSPEA